MNRDVIYYWILTFIDLYVYSFIFYAEERAGVFFYLKWIDLNQKDFDVHFNLESLWISFHSEIFMNDSSILSIILTLFHPALKNPLLTGDK